MNSFFSKPPIFHGILAGSVIAATKFCFYLFNHWEYNLSPVYLLCSFVLIMLSAYMALTAERNAQPGYGYKNALLGGIMLVATVVIIGLAAEQIMYRVIDTTLGAQMKQADLEMTRSSFENNKMFSDADKQKVLLIKQAQKPEDYYSAKYAGIMFLNRFTGNSLFILLLALMFRRKDKSTQ
jgi:hypothetical protein